MAIYHFHVCVISRAGERTVVAAVAYRLGEKLILTDPVSAAAYRSGEQLQNRRDGITYDYTRKQGVVYSEIMLPENAPREFYHRVILWNSVEISEKRKDAQMARDIDVALPKELSRKEQIEIMREFIQKNFIDKGMIADFAIHDKGDGNPHAHIMLTMRNVDENGFGKKNRDWNKVELFKEWRENWAKACNEKLQIKRLDERIDHRTLEAQGIDREPTVHIGVVAWNMEKKGIRTERGNINRAIIARNEALRMHKLKLGYALIDREINKLQNESTEVQREMTMFRAQAKEIKQRAEQIQGMKGQTRYKQSYDYFAQKYKMSPEQAAAEVARLEGLALSKANLQDKLQSKLTALTTEKQTFAIEYNQIAQSANTSPDRQKIFDRLAQLDKKSHCQGESVRELLRQRELERERIRERDRAFERGR